MTDPSTKAEGKECIDDDTVQSLPIATAEGDGGGGGGGREITPEPEDRKPSTEAQETPKMNLINCTNNKENSSSTQKKNNLQLSMCHQSDVVITSFSPRETGVRTEKSFTAILKPKVLVTRAPNTPKSVYSTPKSVLGDDEDEVDKSRDFHTPSTSRKAIKNQKNTSMHLVDYTTPNKLATPASPYLKSALKASAKKHHLTPTVKSCKEKANTADTALGLSPIPNTPVLSDDCKTKMETPSSVISVNSTDTSSVIEILSDESTPGTNANVLLKTPSKTDATKQTVTTPMRTPQSLMKRAILTSTKKQITTPQRSEAAQATPRREPINRIPLRTSIGSLRSPVTPKTGGTEAQISRRLSMSTPSRKSMSSVMTKKLENTPSSTTKASITTTTPSTSRRSSLIPMSASRAQTSTPLNYSNRRHSTCKTSPLNKVRKSVGGVPLSSHISKARRSIITSSPAQYTSIKQKSPQQMMSDRLVTRARKSLGVTPILSRAINMVQSAKASKGGAGTTPSSILKRQTGRKSMAATTSARSVLFADKSKKPIEEAPADLGRSLTFVLDSDDCAKKEIKKKEIDTFDLDKETQDNKEKEKTLNVTFSPDKEKVADAETRSLDIPIDVEELIEKDKCQDNDEILRGKVELQEGNDTVPLEQIEERDSPEEESSTSGNGTTADENKTCATEECFAEVISDSQEENQIEKEIDEEKAEVVGNFTEETEKVSETSRNPEENETGFGEESSLIEKLHSADSNKSERVEETKSNEVEQLITDDVIELDSTAEGSDLEKSIRTESDTKDIPEKLCSVYKPICEDITLEGSVIEGSVIVSEKSIVEENPDNKTSNEKEPSSEGSVLKEEKVDGNEAKNSTITTEVLLEESVTEEQDTNQTEFERPTESLPAESKSEEDEQLQDSVLSADEPVLDKSVTVGEEEQHITEVSLDDSVTGVQDTNKNVIEERIETLSDDLKSEEQQKIKDNEPLADESILEKSVTVEEKIQNLSDKQDTNQTEFEGRTESLPEESKSGEQSADESILEKSVTVEVQVKSQTEAGISPTKEEQTADLLSEEQQIGVDNENSAEAEESEAKESDALNSSVEDRTKAPHVSKKHDAEQKKQSEEENTNESLSDESLSQQLDNSQQEISISDNLSEEINKSQTEDNNSVVEEGTEADNSVTKQLDKNLASNDLPMEEPNSAVSLTDAEEDSSINVDESKQTKKDEGTPDPEESDNLKENISCASKDNEDPNESVSEHNISEVEKSPEQPERIVTSDLHSTSKLLEQIEDVLNKSDEMKQKHLEENKEDCESINTLTEENESIKLTQDSISDCPPIEEYCAIDATTVDDEDPKNVTTGGENDVEDDIVTEKESFDVSKEETEKVEDIPVEKENNSEESVDNKPQKSSDVDNVGNDEISANKRISPTNINHKLIENQSNAGTPKRRSRRASMLIENTDEAKENIDMSLQNVAKKLLETECGETTATTPRRSLRRKSIANTTTTTDSSNDVDGGENKSDVRQLPTFTPRRSARRASMSIEMTNTNTPTSKKSRRASLSAVSEAPLTPKRITRRRSSISLDNDEVVKVIQESPTTSAAAPAQRDLPISEEINEDMGAIIEEEEEEDECVKSKKSTQGNNMNEDELNEGKYKINIATLTF